MYKIILRSLDDAGMFAVVALILFFFFFLALFTYVISMKKEKVSYLADMPNHDPSTFIHRS